MRIANLILSFITLVLVLALLGTHGVCAQTVNLGTTTVTVRGSAQPILTWSTSPAASSCAASGGWTGTKAASGSETEALITATTTYVLTCTFGPNDTQATMIWTPVTSSSDGKPLADVNGYKVYYGLSPSALTLTQSIPGAATKTAQVSGLQPGLYYFALAATSPSLGESAPTPAASKTIAAATTQSAQLAVTVTPIPTTPATFSVQ